MSTATHVKRRSFFSSQKERPRAEMRRHRRWPWLAALGVLGLIWLLPMLVSHSFVASWVIQRAGSQVGGNLTVQGISLGWFSPIQASQVAVRDEQGQTVLEAAEAESDRTLLSLLLNLSSPGRFRVERPHLTLVLRPDGSNVEDLIARLPESSGGAVDMGIDIADGTVSVLDTATQRQWQIKGVQGSLTLVADQQKPIVVTSSATIDDASHPGRFQVDLAMRQSGYQPGDGPPLQNTAKLNAEGLPLDMLQSVLGRVLSNPIRLGGWLTSTVEGSWDRSSQGTSLTVGGKASAEQFRITEATLGTDEVRLAKLEIGGQTAWQDGRLKIDQLDVQSDLGRVQASGSLEVGGTSGELLASLPQQTYHVETQLDLARLAALLPTTLRLQKNTQITSGLVKAVLDSRRGSQGMLWQGQLTSSKLQAVNGGRTVTWEKPIQVAFSAHQTDKGPVVESLVCESDFLKVSGSGTTEKLTATATLNLDRLAEELRGLIDLGQLRLSGTSSMQLSWERTPQQTFRADGQWQVRNFEFSLPDRPAWREGSLNVRLAATGSTDFTADTRVDTALLQAGSGSEQLEAQLMQPVARLADGGPWRVQIRAQGQLEQWRPRLAPWVDLNDCQFAGSHQMLVQITGSTQQIEVHRAQISVSQLAVSGPGVRVEEPRVDLLATGAWKWSERSGEVAQATLSSQSLAVQLNQGRIALPKEGDLQMTGLLHVQGDLSRLQQWITAAGTSVPTWRVAGLLSGDVNLKQADGKTAGTVEATVRDVAVMSASGSTIRQPVINVAGRGDYDPACGIVHLQRATLTSQMASLELGGEIATAAGQPRVDLEGHVQYDLGPISELLQAILGTSVRASGRGASPVAYHGPLDLVTAEGSAALDWTSLEMYGFRVGPGSLQAKLAGGTVNFRPLELDVNEGKVRLTPRIQLAKNTSMLSVQPGRVADQVRINPAMCMSALKYIAPALAGVAAAEGRFSIDMDQLQVPLEQPERGRVDGRMIVHSVEIGPGPLLEELALALGYKGPAQIARESTIDFQMANGRVYHRGLALNLSDVTVRTQGSVGFDKSLSLVAEMPVPPKWQANKAVSSALREQTLRLPVGGTLDRPKLDRGALEQVSRQFLQGAAQNLLQEQLNKGLDRLFNPPQKQ